MSKDDISPDDFVSGKTIHNYFDSFARDHNLLPRLRLRTRSQMAQRQLLEARNPLA
ncbi:cofactor FMO1 enzyme is FAD [Colletotrichum abscissum]|uniref:Cofactor FMO1 enzyme is FAD n=1 Tax=Colletotrichum abscissum TaxID=1671311 RepID=A0A9P9XEQ3_9PEZI|nr:cofactor FMO1 enzyme is FAD [Colletotrichum abscissum]